MRLSIITVNLNNKAGLEQTLKSVFEQTSRDYEIIVIDGFSSDGSRDVIGANVKQIHKWISEKDAGIFNAMNKGIRMAEGEYILFLNSGDNLYSPDTLNDIFKLQFSEDFVVCDIELVKNTGREIRNLYKEPREILILGEIYHQAVLHHRRVFDRLGLYDETFPLMADYELFLRGFFKSRCTWRAVHETIVEYDHMHGLSSNPANSGRYLKERLLAQRKNFDSELVDALENQRQEIESLSRFKSMYEGLMQSHSVLLALRLSGLLRKVRKPIGNNTTV